MNLTGNYGSNPSRPALQDRTGSVFIPENYHLALLMEYNHGHACVIGPLMWD
jgi:hypothetical protein